MLKCTTNNLPMIKEIFSSLKSIKPTIPRVLMKCDFLLISIFIVLFQIDLFSQTIDNKKNQDFSKIEMYFQKNQKQKFGFDELKFDSWKQLYSSFKLPNGKSSKYAYKSLAYKDSDWVNLIAKGLPSNSENKLKLLINEKELNFSRINDSLFSIYLPQSNHDFTLNATFNNLNFARLRVRVFQEVKEKIIIVPLVDFTFNTKEISSFLNSIYQQANLKFDLEIKNKYSSKIFNNKLPFSNPDSLHLNYTGQMRLLRDLYFNENPSLDKNAHYVFVIPGFIDTTLNAYMAKNKSLAFVKHSKSIVEFCTNLSKALGFGVGGLNNTWRNEGPEKGSTSNLMDIGNEIQLTHFQWKQLHANPNFYAFYDNEEIVKTNNGTVAYYFWKEDSHGNVLFSNKLQDALHRPYKKNFLSYRFQVKYAFLRPFYKIGPFYISIVNVIFVLLIFVLLWFIRKWIKKIWIKYERKRHYLRRAIYLVLFLLAVFHIYESLKLSNSILDYFKLISGPVEELKNEPYAKVKKTILIHPQLRHKEEYAVCSEILIHKNNKWHIKKRMKVLYFDVKQDTILKKQILRLNSTSDTLKINELNYCKKVFTHYFVFNFKDDLGKIFKQEVYTHQGKEITEKLKGEDPPKRIVLFVNGYRPTSIGNTFEDNFSDIRKNGLEFPNSKNYIYDFDRYEYWRPWNEINLMFQKRINASEAYYADGHFSVSTSNYKSLLNFTSLSQTYPKRCLKPSKHTCTYMDASSWKKSFVKKTKTVNSLKMTSNKKGFNLRKRKGRLAARNLLQILNEQAGYSKNDTIFIVAHSMGFAYSQGMIEELRGKIQFGAYYIIAPENAKSGKVNEKEWKEIWQYGSNFNLQNADAPCLQDGVAPQSKVFGLSAKKRVFIPEKLYTRKGFFESHFIGYYTWVFDVQEDERGYIKNR